MKEGVIKKEGCLIAAMWGVTNRFFVFHKGLSPAIGSEIRRINSSFAQPARYNLMLNSKAGR
jgi:hypothetical protein